MNRNGSTRQRPIYTALSYIYDTLMHDVDYEQWADYVDDLIQIHAPETEKILELACGTGTVALSMEELGYYTITATDASSEMIRRAQKKAKSAGSRVRFKTVDFLNIDLEEKFDLVFLIFDSINYLHTEQQILRLHEQVSRVLKPGGFFLFDFTTPKNSRQAVSYLDNEKGITPESFRFLRKSRFDAKRGIHTNEFEIDRLNRDTGEIEETFVEVHQQKIYTFRQMMRMVAKTGFRVIQSYDEFSFKPANHRSLRITVVSQWGKTK